MDQHTLEFYWKTDQSSLIKGCFDCALELHKFVLDNFEDIIIPEIWKDVEGFNGRYKVSNHGRIRSYTKYYKGKIMSPHYTKNAYLRVDLYNPNVDSLNKNNRTKHLVHNLVADLFCFNPDPDKFDEVDHISRESDYCPFWNLRWIDRQGNVDNRSCSPNKLDIEALKKVELPF